MDDRRVSLLVINHKIELMNKVKVALSLIRLPNLIIIVISMTFIQLFVITPLLGINGFEGGLNILNFALLVLSTLLISVGGYIINDIFDINPDSLNKPSKNIVNRNISIGAAYKLYWLSTVVGILVGTYVSYEINHINFGLIFIFSAGLLWFYSQKYSCQPFIGNLVISLLSALSFGVVWLFEFYSLSGSPLLFIEVQTNFPIVNRVVMIYMGFAFFVTLIREVIKDMEDIKGDERFGCTTFAVKFGISASKILAIVLSSIALIGSIFTQYYFYHADYMPQAYYFVIMDLLLILVMVRTFNSKYRSNYSNISNRLKLLMVAGILSMVLFTL